MHDLNIMIFNLSFVDNKIFLIAVCFLLVCFLKYLHGRTCCFTNLLVKIWGPKYCMWLFCQLEGAWVLWIFLFFFFHYVFIITVSFFSLNPSLSPKKLILLKMITKEQSRDAQHQRVQQNLHLRFHPGHHHLGYLHRNLMF